jgi:hypothetical protein
MTGCIGITVLRLQSPTPQYPIGTSHSSLEAMRLKVFDALLAVRDRRIQAVLQHLLDMDGNRRMRWAESFEVPSAWLEGWSLDRSAKIQKWYADDLVFFM